MTKQNLQNKTLRLTKALLEALKLLLLLSTDIPLRLLSFETNHRLVELYELHEQKVDKQQ